MNDILVSVPDAGMFELWFRRGSRVSWERRQHPFEGPLRRYEDEFEAWLQEATLANAQRWSNAAHAGAQVMLSLFADDCPHPNPESDPKYDGVDFFQHRVLNARRPWTWESSWLKPNPYTVAFMEAAAAQHSLVAEFEQAMTDWETNHGVTCQLSEMGTICRTCAEAHDEWDDDGMEPSGCRLKDDAAEAYGDFWYANGERDS